MADERVYTFMISENQVNVIGAALGKLPFEVSAPIIGNLQQQIAGQTKAENDNANEAKAVQEVKEGDA